MSEETPAQEEIQRIVSNGQAKELLDAWHTHSQSCAHTDRIIDHVAAEGSEMTAQDFARSLQEEAGK